MRFPTAQEVIALHDEILRQTGGVFGILAPGAVESAIERARWGPFPGDGNLAERAGLLLRGLVLDHPFADGNKRIAIAAADAFLSKNGAYLGAPPEEIERFMLEAARGCHDVSGITAWISRWLRQL